MPKFRKKPVVIEAKQYTGEERNTIALYEWIHDVELSSIFGVASAQIMAECAERGGLMIPTLEGNMLASKGDWIIKGVKGEFYPCKPDVFAATYEPVEETEMTPEQIEKERVAFERYITETYTLWASRKLPVKWKLTRKEDGYFHQLPQTAWITWLARAKAAKSEIDYAYTTGFHEGHPVWIREKDMRPSDEEWVLVCIDYDDGKEVDIAFYCEGGHAFIDPPNVMIDGVTHWQPLPPPPKGD